MKEFRDISSKLRDDHTRMNGRRRNFAVFAIHIVCPYDVAKLRVSVQLGGSQGVTFGTWSRDIHVDSARHAAADLNVNVRRRDNDASLLTGFVKGRFECRNLKKDGIEFAADTGRGPRTHEQLGKVGMTKDVCTELQIIALRGELIHGR